jgi:hypothetical protein
MNRMNKTACTTLIIAFVIISSFVNMGFKVGHEEIGFFQTQPTATPLPAKPTMKEYVHPSNTFSLLVPSDWKVTENTGYALFSAPDSSASVEIFAENTQEPLSTIQFNMAIDSLEHNVFSGMKNYKETKREIQSDKGYAIISKTFDINKVPFQCSTIYEIKEKGLYVESYYSAVSAVAATGPIFSQMDASFKSNPAYLADLDPFTSGPVVYTDADNLFVVRVPALWTYANQKDGAIVTFASPDENAFIMLVKENQGKTVTRTMADQRTLAFLNSIVNDLRIVKTTTLPNGSFLMSWEKKAGDLKAASIYKWNGKYWFILTWMVNSSFEKTYSEVFNKSMDSYTLPE